MDNNIIHLNNASASLPAAETIETIYQYLLLEQKIGPIEAQIQSQEKINQVYQLAATLLGCNENEIALTQSATDAAVTLLQAIPWEKNDIILMTPYEHVGIYNVFKKLQQQFDLNIEIIPLLQGELDLAWLQKKLQQSVKMVSIVHLASHGGHVVAAKEIGKMIKNTSAYYFLDAAQTIGQVNINVRDIQCDFMVVTGRKFLRAPRGTGILYVKQNTLQHSARMLETNEPSYALRLGLGAAIQSALDMGLDVIAKRVQLLAQYLVGKLLVNEKIKILPEVDGSNGIVMLTGNFDATKMQNFLQQHHPIINVKNWAAGSSPLMNFKQTQSFIRISPHYYNTLTEIDQCIAALLSLEKTC